MTTAADAAQLRAAGRVAASPPAVLRGANCHTARRELRIDWLRMTGPTSEFDAVVKALSMHFGDHETAAGRYFYDLSMRWEGGAGVFFDQSSDRGSFLLEIPGRALASMTVDERISILVWFARLGFKATRIDLALDFHGDNLQLIQSVHASCEASELVHARTWSPRLEYTAGRIVNHGVTIGKRGKLGSGRFIRVYDKGLETKTAPAGAWHRLEVEFSDQAAMLVSDTLAGCGADGFEQASLGFIFGAVDFRTRKGIEQHINRRERCQWWQDLLDDATPVCVRVARDAPDLRRYMAWVQRCVAPTILQMMERTDMSLAQIWRDLVGKTSSNEADQRLRPVVWQYVHRHIRRERAVE